MSESKITMKREIEFLRAELAQQNKLVVWRDLGTVVAVFLIGMGSGALVLIGGRFFQ